MVAYRPITVILLMLKLPRLCKDLSTAAPKDDIVSNIVPCKNGVKVNVNNYEAVIDM